MKGVLVVDDLPEVRRRITSALGGGGAFVFEARDGLEALEVVRNETIGVVVSDIRMPRMGGLELLRALREFDTPVILHSGFHDVDAAVAGLRLGAIDVLPAPLDYDRLRKRVDHCLRQVDQPFEMVGDSAVMRRIRRRIRQIAQASEPVLVTGESGVGKEVVARAIHLSSARTQSPFMAVNLCALSSGTLESELFGHEKGAFTGAISRRRGLFERAQGGTLLLDEIGDAPIELQTKLLRVVETRAFERVGGSEPLSPDVRIVAATNRELPSEIACGRFREDLWYRISALRIDIPPLRERPEDIVDLVRLELRRCSEERGLTPFELDDPGLELLREYGWPGNARQVRLVARRMAILADQRRLLDAIDVQQALSLEVDPHLHVRGTPAQSQQEFHARERTEILAVLDQERWNVSAAARKLGLSRGALRNRMRRLRIAGHTE